MRNLVVVAALFAVGVAVAAQEPVAPFDPVVAVARAWDLLEHYLEQGTPPEQASAVAALAGADVPRAAERLLRVARQGPLAARRSAITRLSALDSADHLAVLLDAVGTATRTHSASYLDRFTRSPVFATMRRFQHSPPCSGPSRTSTSKWCEPS